LPSAIADEMPVRLWEDDQPPAEHEAEGQRAARRGHDHQGPQLRHDRRVRLLGRPFDQQPPTGSGYRCHRAESLASDRRHRVPVGAGEVHRSPQQVAHQRRRCEVEAAQAGVGGDEHHAVLVEQGHDEPGAGVLVEAALQGGQVEDPGQASPDDAVRGAQRKRVDRLRRLAAR
jgi:hypothetical protein